MIKVLCKKLIKTDKDTSIYYVELVCDEISELPSPAQYDGWVIDMGSIVHIVNSGETYMLNSDGKWISQKKNSDVTFTQADKEKLDSLANPILLKGRVDTVKNLPTKAETGWLYFVGKESAVSFAEYIFTESKQWEYVGDNSIDLGEYVKNTDYATSSKVGVVRTNTTRGTNTDSSGVLNLVRATDTEISQETSTYKPLVPAGIPALMRNYGITSKNLIGEMQTQDTLNRLSIGLQRKNLLMSNCKDHTLSSISCVIDPNGVMTFNGSSGDSSVVFYWNMQTGSTSNSTQYNNNKKWFPNGNYILSGGADGINIQMRVAQEINSEGTNYSTNGNPVNVTITEADKYVWTRIQISPNRTFQNVSIYPMLRCAEIEDEAYEPYVPDLQEQINELKIQIEKLNGSYKASSLLHNEQIQIFPQ